MNDEVLCPTEIELIAAYAAYALDGCRRVDVNGFELSNEDTRKDDTVVLACCYAKRERLPFVMRDNRIRQRLYYLLQPDSDGSTVFHIQYQYHEHDDYRRLKLLLSALDYEDQKHLVLCLNNKRQSVLHKLNDSLVGILLNFCEIQPFPIEYLLQQDVNGNTPLHLKPSDNLVKYLLTQHRGMLINILKQRNCFGQNAFHAAARIGGSLIWQLCDLVDIEDLTSGDKSGMSVIDYLMELTRGYGEVKSKTFKGYSDITEFIHLLPIPSVAASIIRKLPDCKQQQVICKVNPKRQTVLHAAVMDRWPESVSLFLGH